jgi:hypothetical protein
VLVKALLVGVSVSALVGVIFTFPILGIFPGVARLVAPLVCPDTTHQVIIERQTNYSRGRKSVNWDIYCLDAQGFGTIPDSPYPSLMFWAGSSALTFLGLLATGLTHLRKS